MGRKAKPLQEQVRLLEKRGMIIAEPEKARRILLEIGWYRMSFYWFPFETRYPDRMNPLHEFRPGTCFEDALLLYAFDFNLRHTLMRPLERIETAFRTYLIYSISSRYPDNPEWFADPRIVGPVHARQFERTIYNTLRRTQPEIELHHRRFPRDKFAPAWKTLEFMTFGAICTLFYDLKSDSIRQETASHFGIHNPEVLCNYLEVIRILRNLCAHGNMLFSWRPPHIMRGPAMGGKIDPPRNLKGALAVVSHFLGVISPRLQRETENKVKELITEFSKSPGSARILESVFGK